MARSILLDSNSNKVVLEEAESANVTATFYDADGGAINKASLLTLTATLINAADGAVINSRNAQNVLDANGGTLSTAGVLTLRLQPDDNAIVLASDGTQETHYLLLTWTWSDGVSTRTGKQEFEFYVRALMTPVP